MTVEELKRKVQELEGLFRALDKKVDRMDYTLDAVDARTKKTEKTLENLVTSWTEMQNQARGAVRGAEIAWNLLKVVAGLGGGALLHKLLSQ